MVDFSQVVGLQWDSGNHRKNVDKHGVNAVEAEQIFFNDPLLVVTDLKHSGFEERFHALGKTDEGRRLHVTFTVRGHGTLLRIISARDMSRKERLRYDEEN